MANKECELSEDSESEDECSRRVREIYGENMSFYDVDPRIMKEMNKPCDGYQAAWCARVKDRKTPILGDLGQMMSKTIGSEAYNDMMSQQGHSKSVEDSILMRRIVDMLDMKNKVMNQQAELAKAFGKMHMSYAASQYQNVLEATEDKIRGIYDQDEAEEVAAMGVQQLRDAGGTDIKPPKPRITVLGYIGCYNNKEEKNKQERTQTKKCKKSQ